MTSIFIDGQAGTTGLEIANRLAERRDITLLTLDDAERKTPGARASALKNADIAILCLPDDAAREAVALAAGGTRLVDASTAHRTSTAWVYGLPELCDGQRAAIANAHQVSNPGCYAQGFILLARPLVDGGLLPADAPLNAHALSGFSGGGRSLIDRYAALPAAERSNWAARPYALGLAHKHLPEMQHYSGLATRPLFAPMVADFYQGMLVHLPLFTRQLNCAQGAAPQAIHNLLTERYANEPCIRVWPLNSMDAADDGYLDPTACNHSNRVDLLVFGHAEQVLLVARLDNLGKGASGAAVQNLNLMMGIDELTGLTA